MFKKYHVHTREAKPRFTQPVRSGIIDWSSGCIGCVTCVKKVCPQNAYELRLIDPVTLQDNLDAVCADCFRCVQSCPQRLIQKTLNPEYESLGDEYWTPKIISATWDQATTGKIPVSGAGYGGPFSGPGFDAMWTDMSEIVRPTRDGIHGREYISTAIQLGRRRLHLGFDAEGRLTTPVPPLRELQLPMVFTLPPGIPFGPNVIEGVARAAVELDTLFLAPAGMADGDNVVPIENEVPAEVPELLWLTGSAASPETAARLADEHPQAIVGFAFDFDAGAAKKALAMVEAGAGVLHLRADDHGRTPDGTFIKEAVREVHLALVGETLRDQVTILVSGGLAMAEHVAKVIICGADGVVVDWPLLLALECRYCRSCRPAACPVAISDVRPTWAAQRIMNLIGAWRDQLLEVMGAMGIREIRRLRGEVGRAMFYEELEAEIFAPIFGQKTAAQAPAEG